MATDGRTERIFIPDRYKSRVSLPYGYRDAKFPLLIMALVGEFVQGNSWLPAYQNGFIVSSQNQKVMFVRKAGQIANCEYVRVSAGGLIFGWNALSLMLIDLGVYSSGCVPNTSEFT